MKRDLEFLATSGRDWALHSRRLAAGFPSLDILSLGLVKKYSFGWRLTRKGEIVLEMMEELVRNGAAGRGETAAIACVLPDAGCNAPVVETAKPVLTIAAATSRRAQFTVIEGSRSNAA